jgi:tetratricopeptide (TPR) repeat protein
MRPFRQQRSLLRRFLPVLVLPAVLIAGTLAVKAQNTSAGPAAAPTPQANAADSLPPITPEDVGDALLVKRRYQEALEAYKQEPSHSADLWNKMGIAYQMLSDLKDAERCYKESLRLAPAHSWTLNNLATLYDAQGDFARAEGFYRKAFAADPSSARIAMNLGTNLMAQRKYSEGSQMYKQALALDREVFEDTQGPASSSGVPVEQRGAMNYYKAKDYAQAGMIDRAIEYLQKSLNEGYASPADVAQDSSFAGLRGNPAFQQMMAEHSKQPAASLPPSSDFADRPQAPHE